MKIALPILNGRISPVFDTARRLVMVDVRNGREIGRSEVALEEGGSRRRIARLRELGMNVLLCGAISRPLADMLNAAGVRVVPFLAGEAEEVLAAYLAGRLPDPRFQMPGCRARRRRGRRRRRPGWEDPR